MNNTRLIVVGLLIPALLMVPYSVLSFYTDFANKNPDPSQRSVTFNGSSYNAIEGKRAFEQFQCMGCHTILGNGAYFAPDLTKVYTRMGENDDTIANFMLSGIPPKGMPPMKDRSMDNVEAYRIVAFLKYTNMLDLNSWPPRGSWDRDGGPDTTKAEQFSPVNIWQGLLGIVFFNLLLIAMIFIYERNKEGNI